MDVPSFADRLWGDIYVVPKTDSTQRFTRKPADPEQPRTFVQFILEPIYKMYTQVLSESAEDLAGTLAELGIKLKPIMYKMDVRPLLKVVLDQFFGASTGLVDMITEHVPSPARGNDNKVTRTYSGPQNSSLAESMRECDGKAPVMVNITKLYQTADAQSFRAFGRVMSGTLTRGSRVKVLGEGFSPEDEEDMVLATVDDIWLYNSRYVAFFRLTGSLFTHYCRRYVINAEEIGPGNLVLLGGVDASIFKTATIASAELEDDLYIFRPLRHMTQPVLKVAVEPVNPSELPKMLAGLRNVNKSYPLVTTKVEESGEHVIIGTGELHLDCIMHDLRRVFSEIEIKVSDPVTSFSETVLETSALKCYADTPNKKCVCTFLSGSRPALLNAIFQEPPHHDRRAS